GSAHRQSQEREGSRVDSPGIGLVQSGRGDSLIVLLPLRRFTGANACPLWSDFGLGIDSPQLADQRLPRRSAFLGAMRFLQATEGKTGVLASQPLREPPL